MPDINPDAAGRRENARNKSNGQFGEQHLADPGQLDLGSDQPGYVMADVPIVIDYATLELPSARHRRYVNVTHQFTMAGEIRCVTGEQAPVAFEIDGPYQDKVLREFDGDLYEQAGREPVPFDPDTLGAQLSGWQCFGTEEENSVEPQAKLDDMLVIDGEVWRRAGEPMYVVMTYGLGNNHGGTGIIVDLHYNSNVEPASYFRADEFEQARAYAIETAEGRGDTRYAETLRTMTPTITVQNPDAITAIMPIRETRQVKDARWEYQQKLSRFQDLMRLPNPQLGNKASFEKARQEMDAAFAALAGLTDDIGGFDAAQPPRDGRAGTWRTRPKF